jgi:hypothetical protein
VVLRARWWLAAGTDERSWGGMEVAWRGAAREALL